ncbi:MAG: DEAD/DEAH box helicase [Candidatus Micrarchaeales archaeon]
MTQIKPFNMAISWSELAPYDRLINTETVQPREYQINIIKSVFSGKNSLVILPTGLGKTLIALFAIAHALYNGKKAIILAPTKPLSEQHYNSLTSLMKIESEKILFLTGSITSSKRKKMEEESKIIAATPQTIANDLKAGRLTLEDFGVVVFDECHRAAGRYAYTYIADECKEQGVQLIGLTASPGSKKEKVDALLKVLDVQNIEIRVSTDLDVEKYVMGKETTDIFVEKNPEIIAVLNCLKPVIEEHLQKLYQRGLSPFKYMDKLPKGRLLELGENIKKIQASNYKFAAMFDYVYVLDLAHAYDLVATEGLHPFISYMNGLREREQKSRVVLSILKNESVVQAELIAKTALAKGIEHPKMFKTIQILKEKYEGKSAIVFVQYRSTIKKLVDLMKLNGIEARAFVGKKEGVTNASQAQVISDFRAKKFQVLVATSIGEEGLDIPSVDAVIFYEPVASEIRNIQRKGRTGRFRFGEVVILITLDTKDEAYHMIAKMKEKRMRDLVVKIKAQLDRGTYGFKTIDDKQQRLGI